jgi:lambda repressor-like predicted transcriptional regulator
MQTPAIKPSPHLINYALRSAGVLQQDIALQLGVSPATVSSVINGRARSRHVELRVARITGLTLHELWPQWYDERDQRIKQRGRYQSTAEALQKLHELRPDLREVA